MIISEGPCQADTLTYLSRILAEDPDDERTDLLNILEFWNV